VASEVKALAEQTAKATGEIGQQISGIQAATQESVGAIKEISGTIEKLSEISSTIAAAVESRALRRRRFPRNVQQAAQGTQQVSANITDVQRGASETGSASSQVLSAAQLLSGDSTASSSRWPSFLIRCVPPDAWRQEKVSKHYPPPVRQRPPMPRLAGGTGSADTASRSPPAPGRGT